MTHILIASPTYDGSVRKEYMQAIMQLTDYFRQSDIGWDIVLEPCTMLHTMRSVMASKALHDSNVSHLLFVDTDMGFSVSSIIKLIKTEKDIIGCAYPYRTIPLHLPVTRPSTSLRQTISETVPYAIKFSPGVTTVDVTDGVCEVAAIGTGLLLISCQALQTMVERGTVETFRTTFPYNQWYSEATYYGFFDHIKVDGSYIGEDYSFCHRWITECQGSIHALVDAEIMHIGNLPVIGRYMDRLKTGAL